MVQIAGKYEVIKNENFVNYLKGIGVSVEHIAKAGDKGKNLEVRVDGNNYTLKNAVGERTFPLNTEIDEPLSETPLKSKATLNGNQLVIISKDVNGKAGKRVYDFSDSGLTVTLTSELTKEVGKLVYKRT